MYTYPSTLVQSAETENHRIVLFHGTAFASQARAEFVAMGYTHTHARSMVTNIFNTFSLELSKEQADENEDVLEIFGAFCCRKDEHGAEFAYTDDAPLVVAVQQGIRAGILVLPYRLRSTGMNTVRDELLDSICQVVLDGQERFESRVRKGLEEHFTAYLADEALVDAATARACKAFWSHFGIDTTAEGTPRSWW